MNVLFLDANILFSAAYRENAGLLVFWKLKNIKLISSYYAFEEARRNLSETEQHLRLKKLCSKVELIVHEQSFPQLPQSISLRDKDRPILQAAIAGNATHLITGDIKDFGPYFEKTIRGVTILSPRQYLG